MIDAHVALRENAELRAMVAVSRSRIEKRVDEIAKLNARVAEWLVIASNMQRKPKGRAPGSDVACCAIALDPAHQFVNLGARPIIDGRARAPDVGSRLHE